MKKLICFLVMLVMVTNFFGCNTNDKKEDNDNEEQEVITELPSRPISENVFKSPGLDYLPMVQMHSPTTTLIDDVYNRGYGGIVMNVKWNSTYLNNSREWASFSNCVSYAVDKGMHVWIYDEYGYPSGSAYGQTLEGNPEYEALGLVATYTVIPSGKTGKADLVYGHEAIEKAYIYDGEDENDIDLSSGLDISSSINSDKTSVSYTNRTSSSKILVAYMSKRWYENTHSMENWYCQQRYINMLDTEPTQKFLNITHEKYYENVGDYFGNGVEAFFTDEPALQGNYFSISSRNRTVLDTPDMDIPIIECLNYSTTLFEKFKDKYGYSLEENLGYLYKDDSSKIAKQVRIDFYNLTSELFMNNYLGQTAEWCENHNVKSSGHLLLEETLYQNPWFAGNMIQLLGTMGIPGTDLLYSTAVRAMKDSCITSKFASSAADFSGKTKTFAEISGAFDGTAGDMQSQLNAVGVQVAMGINTFSSYYYQGGDHTVQEDQVFSTAIGRMTYMTNSSVHRAKTLVYYPYEGVASVTLPTKSMYTPTLEAEEISQSFSEVCQSLTVKQVDYDLVDYLNLSKCKVVGSSIYSPTGEKYDAIVIPYTPALMSVAIDKLLEAAEAGVKICFIGGIDSVVSEKGTDTEEKFNNLLKYVKEYTSGAAVGNELRSSGNTYITLSDKYAEDVYATMRENKEYYLFTVVNGYQTDKNMDFTLNVKGTKVSYYNTFTGEITEISGKFGDDVKFNFTLPANTTGFFVVDKG